MHGFVVPRGLDRSCPREVRLSVAGRAVMVLAVGLLVAAALVAALMTGEASRQIRTRERFVAEAVTTDGEVLRMSKASDDSSRYWVQYRFDTPTGRREGRAKLSKSAAKDLQAGSTVEV